jgi:hypothetical protein
MEPQGCSVRAPQGFSARAALAGAKRQFSLYRELAVPLSVVKVSAVPELAKPELAVSELVVPE